MSAATFAFGVQKCDSIQELWLFLERWFQDKPFIPQTCHCVVRRYRRTFAIDAMAYPAALPEHLDRAAYAGLFEHTLLVDLAVARDIAFSWEAVRGAEALANRSLDAFDARFPASFKRLVFSPAVAGNGDVGLFMFLKREARSAPGADALADLEFHCQYVYRRFTALTRRAEEVKLSPRESEIARQIALGKSNRAIAAELGVSANTVDTLVRRIFSKLGVDNRVEAALECVTRRLIQL